MTSVSPKASSPKNDGIIAGVVIGAVIISAIAAFAIFSLLKPRTKGDRPALNPYQQTQGLALGFLNLMR